MMAAVWLLSLPFRLLAALGLRRSVIVACLFVLAVTAYGVAEDLGVIDPPAQAAPARKKPAAGQPRSSRSAVVDIPAGYLRLYRTAGARYRISWSVLAAIGKVESDHGRARLPGVRSGSNWAGACGPMQLGCVPGGKAGNSWARYGHGRPHDPAAAIPAAARYLVDHGARRNLDRALRAAHRRRCPACGTRSPARLPGTTSLAADLALARGQPTPVGRRRWPPVRHPRPPTGRKEVSPIMSAGSPVDARMAFGSEITLRLKT